MREGEEAIGGMRKASVPLASSTTPRATRRSAEQSGTGRRTSRSAEVPLPGPPPLLRRNQPSPCNPLRSSLSSSANDLRRYHHWLLLPPCIPTSHPATKVLRQRERERVIRSTRGFPAARDNSAILCSSASSFCFSSSSSSSSDGRPCHRTPLEPFSTPYYRCGHRYALTRIRPGTRGTPVPLPRPRARRLHPTRTHTR